MFYWLFFKKIVINVKIFVNEIFYWKGKKFSIYNLIVRAFKFGYRQIITQ